jgi:ATP-dependent Zn protease
MLALRAVLSLEELRTLFTDRSGLKEMARAHSTSYMDYLADAEEEAGRILQENAEAVHRLAALLLER